MRNVIREKGFFRAGWASRRIRDRTPSFVESVRVIT